MKVVESSLSLMGLAAHGVLHPQPKAPAFWLEHCTPRLVAESRARDIARMRHEYEEGVWQDVWEAKWHW
jgi:hypothetical protein